jgi:hypothetical protein
MVCETRCAATVLGVPSNPGHSAASPTVPVDLSESHINQNHLKRRGSHPSNRNSQNANPLQYNTFEECTLGSTTPHHVPQGARRERGSRINRGEPLPTDTEVSQPVELSPAAQRVWDRLAPDLIDKRCLTSWDVDLFAVFCDAVATYWECRAALPYPITLERNQPEPTKMIYRGRFNIAIT